MDHNYCKSYVFPCATHTPNIIKFHPSNRTSDAHPIYRKGTNVPRKPHKLHCSRKIVAPPIPSSFDFQKIYRKGTNVPRKPHIQLTPEMIKQRRELRIMRARVARLSNRMAKLKRACEIAKKSSHLGNDHQRLGEKLSHEAATIFQNNLKNGKRQPKGRRYSKELKEFASTLLGYSPEAYAFCRKTLCLPDPNSIGYGRTVKRTKLVNSMPSVDECNDVAVSILPDQILGSAASAVIWEWNEETGQISGSCSLTGGGVLDETSNCIVFA